MQPSVGEAHRIPTGQKTSEVYLCKEVFMGKFIVLENPKTKHILYGVPVSWDTESTWCYAPTLKGAEDGAIQCGSLEIGHGRVNIDDLTKQIMELVQRHTDCSGKGLTGFRCCLERDLKILLENSIRVGFAMGVEFERARPESMKYTIPKRAPRYSFGDVLVTRAGFRGQVNMMFADYEAVLHAGVVAEDWLEIQKNPPSTKDQVFYHLVGDGSVLAGEQDVYSAMSLKNE